jgi:DNA-directed RNA polymerase II subunit RPB9
MLYPREQKGGERRLLYACRNCEHQEEADDFCVYRNELQSTLDINIQLSIPDVAMDPTLPRTRDLQCAQCGGNEVVFWQNHMGRDTGMTLFFACADPNCNHRWREEPRQE